MNFEVFMYPSNVCKYSHCRAGECQLYLDVDCSSVTYDTKPSLTILEAVNKTLNSLKGSNLTEINLSDPTSALANSLLLFIDQDKASKEDIREAYCRDIDSFSWEFIRPRTRQSSNPHGKLINLIRLPPLQPHLHNKVTSLMTNKS